MQDATIRAEEGNKESKNKILVLKVYIKQEGKKNEQYTKGI